MLGIGLAIYPDNVKKQNTSASESGGTDDIERLKRNAKEKNCCQILISYNWRTKSMKNHVKSLARDLRVTKVGIASQKKKRRLIIVRENKV